MLGHRKHPGSAEKRFFPTSRLRGAGVRCRLIWAHGAGALEAAAEGLAAGGEGAAGTEGAGPHRGPVGVKQPPLGNAWCEGTAGGSRWKVMSRAQMW